MKPLFKAHFLGCAAICSLVLTGLQAAIPVSITNASFESPADDEDLVYDKIPVGWNSHNGAIMGTEVYAYNPTSGDFSSEAPEGLNVAGVYWANGVELGLSQTLATTFQEGDAYELTVKVGYTSAFLNTAGYRVQLVVGSTVIAEDDNTQSPLPGQFATSTVSYAYNPAHLGLVGQALQIRLLSKGLTANENEVAFDDVKLFVVLANPIVNAGGPYYLANSAATLSLVGTATPSGTATITAYDWDLDNDGQFDDATGATPAPISFSDLQSLYGMVDGSNTVSLRVTDSAAKTAIANTTVQLVLSTKYTGPNGGTSDTWSVASNWDNGIPQGDQDVVILAGKSPTPWGNATPVFTGNLTLQNNAAMNIGWTTSLLGSYNALGTPGLSKIFMNPGSSIQTRSAGTPIFPEIQLLGTALIGFGSSTQPGATVNFNYPINGAYQLQLQGNSQGGCIANFNVPNSFASIYTFGANYVDGGLTIRGNAAGSLGTGNITIDKTRGSATTSYAILEINAANAMADTATLSISGTTGTILRMNANDTIAAFTFNGVAQPAGTYGSTTSSATYRFAWITGTGILTVGTPAVGYWDVNGTTAGAGGISPAGTWNAANTYWNSNAAGTGSVAAWTAGRAAIFSAGSDATGPYSVDVIGSQDISGFIVRNGAVSLTQGGGGNLRLTANGSFSVSSGSSGIATPISQDASSRSLTVSNVGSLTLSGDLSHTGGTTLVGGTLVLAGNNSAATGATTVNAGTLFVNSANSIPGSGRNVTINSAGFLAFNDSFGSANVQTALNSRVVASSAGTIAANGSASTSFDFGAAGLTAAYFGSLGDLSYTGTLTPQGTTYRLYGEGGTLTMANPNAITGGNSLTVRGSVALAANNDYTGATTVLSNASLSLLGSTATSGITLNSASTLTLGNNGSLGNGTLTLNGLCTLKAVGTVDVSARPIAANSDFTIAGTGTLTLGATTINANRILSNIASGTTTFASIVNGAPNCSLTVEGSGNTTVSGNLTLVNGNLTKNGNGILTLGGANNYFITTINGGVLRLNGSTAGAGTTNLSAATLQLGSASNGGLPIGNLTISHPSAVIQAVGDDRSISNNIILDNNLTFSGSSSLTINGKITHNNADRTFWNNITTTKALTLGNVDLSQNTTNRILTIDGSGNTVINGVIANGGGSTAGALRKNGPGALTLNGANTYAGATTVNSGNVTINGSLGAGSVTLTGGSLTINGSIGAGNVVVSNGDMVVNGSTGGGSITMGSNSKLFVHGSTGAGNVTINSGATLLGAGSIGGNMSVTDGGKLEFDINSVAAPADHDKLVLAAGKSLTFSGSTQLKINGFASIGTYTLITAPGGISGPLPALIDPDDWDASLVVAGNDLQLVVSFNGSFPSPPTLVGIADDKSGGPVDTYTPVTYTITFNEAMNATTVSSADFGNAGTAAVTVDSFVQSSPTVFTMVVTPTTAGTLQLRINQGAALRSVVGMNLNTTSALLDNTTLTVNVPVNGVLAVTSGDFYTVGDPGGPFSPPSKTYTLTNYGSQSLDWTVGKSAAWLDLSSASGTLAAGANTTVTVSANAAANSLLTGAYYDTVAFTNTTTGNGTTSRGASLTVNGLPVQVTLGNLTQTYNGFARSVDVTTDPSPVAYSLTYNGEVDAPTDGGLYDVVVTVTEPGYTGSASANLFIDRAAQTIDFPALGEVGNDQATITLTATSSSGLPVSFASSNSAVATVSGNIATIVGVGTCTITASQVGDGNYDAATSVQQPLSVIRANPLAAPGGPYTVSSTEDLLLDASGSLPSHNKTITTYEWDLDDSNDGGGAFTANVTGATPTAITMAVLQSTYGMVVGFNPIRLRVTDSEAKTSTVSTTVLLTAPLRWDADATYANGQTDGGGGWLSANQWRDLSMGVNTVWTSGRDATFGNGGNGGGVNMPASTSVGLLTFNNFNGTYDIGGEALTIDRGITKITGAGNVDFGCPLVLGGDQTWKVTSGGVFVPTQLNLGPYTLTIDTTTQVDLTGQASSGTLAIGTGGIIKNGTGMLMFTGGADSHQYTGPTVVNAGRIRLGNGGALPVGNMTLNGGIIQAYWGFSVTRALGSGVGQIQLTGGTTGFSATASNGASVTLSNNSSFEAVWGSPYFKPDVFVLEPGFGGNDMSFNNRIDLNGESRTVSTPSGSATATATISQTIRNSSVNPAGLIKTGSGILRLTASNTYNGGTTINQGTLRFERIASMPASGIVEVNTGTTLGITLGGAGEWTNGTSGYGSLGGLLAGLGGQSGSSVTYTGDVKLRLQTANTSYAGDISNVGTSLGLIKANNSTLTLSGSNSFTGPVQIYDGTLSVASIGSVGGGNSNLGAPATVANGTISISIADVSNGALNYTGNGETTNRVISLTGWNRGATISQSGIGLLKFTSSITIPSLGSDNRKTLTLSGSTAGVGEFAGAIIDSAAAPPNHTTALAKSGTGTWILSGTNTYTGATNISQGKLFINGSIAASDVAVANGATLGGTGAIGGNVTVAAGGKLEFNLSGLAASHNPLDIGTGKALTFSGASVLTITSSGGVAPGLYVLVTGGNNIVGALPTLSLPPGLTAGVSISGNQLLLNVNTASDTTPPTLAATSIVDNRGGTSMTVGTLVTYTVTFSEDINDSTLLADDFGNAGTAAVTIGTIAEITPGVFTVQATPTTSGTLQLRVNAGAVVQDTANNNLNTTVAIADNTTMTVDGSLPTLASTSIVDDKGGNPINRTNLVTYTVTFSEDINASTVTAADFSNAGTSSVTFGSVTETSATSGIFRVQVTPTTGGTLQLQVNQGAVIQDAVGNNLNTALAIVDNTTITVLDTIAPTLVGGSIVDNKGGAVIKPGTLVTYTVTFNEDMDASTVAADDFGNGGIAAVTIGAVTETAPGVFSVQATPTNAGSLRLQVNPSAILKDVSNNNLNTGSAILDDTTITVEDTVPTLAAASIVDNKGGASILPNTMVTYTVTFSEDMNAGTVDALDFENAGDSAVTIGSVTETTATSGIFTVQATPTNVGTLQLRVKQNAVLADTAGNNLNTSTAIVDDTTITVETTAPTLVATNIVDDKGGSPITPNTLVTYTVTFNEDMDANSVDAADFGNAGGSAVTIGTVTETAPGVFSVQATPTNIGTLRLRVNASAVLKDVAGNSLNTTAAIVDNTTITVETTPPTLATTDIVDNKGGGLIPFHTLVTYTVTFSEDMNAGSVTADDFGNAGGSAVTIGTVTATTPRVFTVQATPTSGGTLRLQVNSGAILQDVAGNNLNTTAAIIDNTTITVDGALPTLAAANIVDNKGGGLVPINSPVTYTVTFSEDMDASSVTAADFENAGSSTITIGTITESTPGVFSVPVTPTSGSSLQLQIKAGAVLKDVAGNSVDTTTAIADDTTLPVDGALPTLASANIVDNKGGGPIPTNTQVTYTVTFSEDMDAGTVTLADFGNAGNSTVAINSVTETSPGVFTVLATPSTIGTLQLRVNPNAVLKDVAGNSLNTTTAIVDNNTISVDGLAPTLTGPNIVDNKGGAAILPNTLVTYTVSFSEDMNAATVTAVDFGNAGTSAVTFGSITETTAGVFTVQVTPTTSGTLQLKVNAGAVLQDLSGFNLNTAAAIVDNTTITVDGAGPTLAPTAIVDSKGGVAIAANTLVTYTVTFSEDMNASTVSAADFGNAGTSTVTIGTVTESSPGVFSVPVTPTNTGTLQLKVNAGASLQDVLGNSLNTTSAIADNTTITVDGSLPTLAPTAIVDNKSGGALALNTLVTYTVTFSEDMNASTVTAADFGNAGTSVVTIGSVTEITPGVFTVQATPTTGGTLQLKVNANAVLQDVIGNKLNTTAAIVDNTTLTVDGSLPTLAATAIVDNKSGVPITPGTLVTYTVTFSEDMNANTVTAADFGNAGTSLVTFGAVTETTPGVFTVQATPTSAGTLRLRVNAGAILQDVIGNKLGTGAAIADNTIITVDGSLPTLAPTAIVDNKGGARILPNTLVTYTVSFSEDMNASTVSSADFGNAGTSAVTIGAVAETTPGVFTVQVTPTTAGTLRLRVNAGASLKDVAGNSLATTTAIIDNTTITVDGTPPALLATSFIDNKGGAAIAVNTLVTYTVSFSEDINSTTVTAADFGNAGTSSVTFGTITESSAGVFSVKVTPTTVGTLRLRVNAAAVVKDVAGNNLNTASAIADNTTITVKAAVPAPVGMLAADTSESYYTIDPASGLKYLTIVIHKSPGTEMRARTVEVSGNLVDWFSGSSHTTVLSDDATILMVRDNTPVTSDTKRYIRLKP